MTAHGPVIFPTSSKNLNKEPTVYFRARCVCRWQHWHLASTAEDAERDYEEHLVEVAAISVPVLSPGDRVQFDGEATSWLVRANACGDRYAIATAAILGEVNYTIVDRIKGIRGPLNIVGGGMGIDTTDGPDEGIDDTIRRLEGRPSLYGVEVHGADPNGWDFGEWKVSHRNSVPVLITKHTLAAVAVTRA